MKGKVTAVLFIVVFLLIVAVICTVLTGQDKQPGPTEPQAPQETTNVIDNNQPGTASPSPSPTATVSTPVPTATASPSPSPTPTPSPTATVPPSYNENIGSGSFKSNSGAKLDINANWSAQTISDSQVQVTVTVSLDSYSMHLQAVPNSVNISLDGQFVSLDAPAIDYDGNALINTELASKTFTIDLSSGQSKTMTLAVEWHFGGTYGEVEVPVLECGGSISLSR